MSPCSVRAAYPMERLIPRFVLGAARSDSGKTTLALGLITALRRRGLTTGAAKIGPDFIDAAHLRAASGRPARNLDAWLAPEEVVLESFARGYADADVVVVEGVMGLFDGRHGSGEGSTAHVAMILGAPVVLVLDCAKASATIGAVAYGLAHFDPRLQIAGTILNRVASDRHAETVSDAVRKAGLPVLGSIRSDDAIAIESRHLGLAEPGSAAWAAAVERLADTVEREIDIDALLSAASAVPLLARRERETTPQSRVRLAIARDEAFWFYDEASLDALRDGGAELVAYSPLRDRFPDADAALIGGGYPEMHAAALEANVAARTGLRDAIASGLPTYAECGGLMYLCRDLTDTTSTHVMVGAVPGRAVMSPRRSALRYVEARALRDGPLFAAGDTLRGHEFHYSKMTYAAVSPAYEIACEPEGYAHGTVHASYVHVHLGAQPRAVQRFLDAARAYRGCS
jgi:cobyrinic acid a,c-diamide synthase